MSSNFKSMLPFSLSLVLIFSTGCGQLFGEKPPLSVAPDTKLGFETQCLENVLPVMKAFMAGTAKESEVRGTWKCFGNGISAFQRKVKGSNKDRYSATELAKFFEDFFLAGIKISNRPVLLAEVMHLKQIMVGGGEEHITRDELSMLIDFAQKMEDISIDLLPYMKVYAQSWTMHTTSRFDENVVFFENANLAMQQAAKDLAAIISRNEHGYTIRNFLVLMREMESLYQEKWEWLNNFETMMPLIEKFKGTLAGGEPETIAPNEWRRFTLLGGRGYIQYLRYYYFIEKAEETGGNQLAYMANSIDDLFSYLGDMVKEKPSGVFTKRELYEIINSLKKLFPKINISEDLVNESMKLKTLLFGGSTETWTPVDFTNAQGKVQAFRRIAERFMNFSELYLFKWKALDLPDAQAQEFFQNAENNIIESSAILGGIIETQYDIQDFVQFCNEFDKLFPPSPDKPAWTEKVRSFIPVVISYKQIVLSDDNSVIQKTKWNDFLLYTAKAYSRALYAFYFLKDTNMFYSTGLHSLDKFVRKTNEFLTEVIMKRAVGGQSIRYNELDNLVMAISKSGFWLEGVRTDTIKSLLRVLFDRALMDPVRRLNHEKPDGLSLDALSLLQSEYNLWSANQHLLEVVYQSPEQELSTESILASLKNSEQTEGTRELIGIFTSPISMSLRTNGMLEIKSTPSLYLLKSASIMNLSRVVSRAILRSYAMDLKRIQDMTGTSAAEVDVLFNDIRPLVVELGLIEPENVNFARNRFFEANLFTPSADGNDYMSFREGAHLVIMIISGLKLNNLIDPVIRNTCQVQPSNASHYRDRAMVRCASKVYYQNREVFFASMPDMEKYLQKMSEQDFESMFVDLLSATGWKPNSEGMAMLGDLGLLPHIFQYEEMLLQRFDFDKSGTLTDEEADIAYPIYGPLINKVSPTKIKVINKTAFYYLVKNGSIPHSFKEIMSLLKDVIRREVFHKPIGINSDRLRLSKVFGAIAEAVRSSAGKQTPINPPKQFEQGIDVDNQFHAWEFSN